MSVVVQKEKVVSIAVDPKKELLKRTIGKNLTDDELELFGHVCTHTGLDPFLKQIFPVKRKTKQKDEKGFDKWIETMVIQVGVDGLRSIADRTGNYAPGQEPVFSYDKEGKLVSATSYIKKRTPDGVWHTVSATAFWKEFAPKDDPEKGKFNHFYNNMPHLMLAKCAESLALKRAFPAQTAQLVTHEEMLQNKDILIQEPEVEMLSEHQCAELDLLMQENSEAAEKLSKRLQGKSIYEIDPKDFDRTVEYLKKKKEGHYEQARLV